MNDKIITFLNSDLLDKYLIGNTTAKEAEMVEAYILKYPDVKNAFDTLQHSLEVVSKRNAVEAPNYILDNILDVLDEKPVIAMNNTSKEKSWYRFGIAASIAALIFAGSTFMFYMNNHRLICKCHVC